ncbi:MAG: aminopeptidase P family protein [Chloroflexi bacterium]|nr:aminopeptidase P family protein [Chloroflexota bacterium]
MREMTDDTVGCSDLEMEPAPGPDGVTAEEYRLRMHALKEAMARRNIGVSVVHNSRDVFYYSGTGLYCTLIVPRDDDPVLLVRINAARAHEDSWIPQIRESTGPGDVKEVLGELGLLDGPMVGIEEDATVVSFHRKLLDLLPGARFLDISTAILDQRMVKSPAEIGLIRRAAAISDQAFREVRRSLRPGISEMDIAVEMESSKRRAGHDGANVGRRPGVVAPTVFVASGPNAGLASGYWVSTIGPGPSNAFPYGPSLRKVKKGDMVVVDHGTVYRGYHCDEGRTLSVGRPGVKLKRLFDVVRRAEDAAIQRVKPGLPVSELYMAALRVVEDAGYRKYFMGYGQYGVEYLGHGVGLEIDEPPLIGPGNASLIEEGMVLALEPKLIVPGWGGVDLEDTLYVTCDGCELLTRSRRELVEVG